MPALRRAARRAIWPAIAALAIMALLPSSRARAQRPDSSGTIVGVVVAAETGAPLAFSLGSIPARGLDRLANDRGVFVITNVPAGPVEVLVRHLGYSPRRVTTTVNAGAVDSVHVVLSHLAIQLGAVQVTAHRVCTNPGPPKASSEPAFASLFEQLEQNADAYRLLAATYPFTYDMERRRTIRYVAGDEVVQNLDTIRVNTGVTWHYAPGGVVERSDDPRNRQVVFKIPALIHFAEPSFLANHCFYFGGRERVAGLADATGEASLIRVDFLAASRLKAPDVDGSMYIDPVSYQIRRSVLRLTRIPEETPEIASVVVTTDFRTIVPSIAIASLITSTHRLWADTTRPVLPLAVHETQRLLRVDWLNIKPPGA